MMMMKQFYCSKIHGQSITFRYCPAATSGLHIYCKAPKHMFVQVWFDLHLVVMIPSSDLSQEIFAIGILKALTHSLNGIVPNMFCDCYDYMIQGKTILGKL